MVVVVIDGSTILSFVNDDAHFRKSVRQAFTFLDINSDGVLSRSELRRASETLRLMETHFGVDVATSAEEMEDLHRSIFEKFDGDKSGAVDEDEFANEMRNILAAIADGLGFSPVQMALEEDEDEMFSFIKQAADLEASKISA